MVSIKLRDCKETGLIMGVTEESTGKWQQGGKDSWEYGAEGSEKL